MTNIHMTITWKIGGEAGFGIMTTGVMFSRLATRHGYHIFDYIEYPSLIRGGHNVYEVNVGAEEVFSQEKQVDLLFALNQETIDLHKNEMKDGGLIAYDNEISKIDPQDFTGKNVILYPIPFTRLTKEAGALKVMENNVVLGASAALLGMDLEIVNQLIADTFKEKGDKVIVSNQAAAKVGYDYVLSHKPNGFTRILKRINTDNKKLVLAGNEAVVLGAIAAGCKFYCAYPMTPTSNALHAMAEWGSKYGVVVKHAEDEISVINMAIGASFAGVRSMVGTAGGGFSLMVEGMGLAGITETPLVILEGQRPGPATGLPTWTTQGDLQFLIHASQDEFLRIILAPGDAEEAFYLTSEAFNLADMYQTPVFVLIDKYLAESHKSTPVYDLTKININRGKLLKWEEGNTVTDYLRYKDSDDGISTRAVPGMKKTVFTANSYEHTEYGFATEDANLRKLQVDKRNKKMATYLSQISAQKVYGDESPELTIVAWGSTKGPVLEALKRLKAQKFDKKVNFLHLTHVWPLPVDQINQILGKGQKLLLIEGNSQAQMGALIRQETGTEIKEKLLKYDGRPFYPEEIIEEIKMITK
jgi:2-oxoglutarate/2-oxoacid ferredoxin oxidoreductase subunit alpha